jgi:multidrug efflux pump subunit AcrA (membrane-fusion protein)
MTQNPDTAPLQLSTPARRPRRRWWLPLAILSPAVVIAGALIATKPTPPPVEVRERAWLVSTQAAATGTYRPAVTLYGRVESLWSSSLTAGIAADVEEVMVVDGDFVAKGDLLVRLDDRDARLELAQRDAELKQADARIASEIRRHEANVEALPREQRLLALARSEVSRLQDLVTSKVGAQSQLDTARQAAEQQAIALLSREQAVDEHDARLAEVEAARLRSEALRDQALLALERTQVRAPFNGRIAKVHVAPGKRMRVGDPMVELFDTDALVVRAQIPNRLLRRVRETMTDDQAVRVSGEVDGVEIEARLRSLAGAATSGTGGIDGIFALQRGGELVSQGRFIRLSLELPPLDGLIAVPHEAIYGVDRIYTVDADNRLRQVAVTRVGETRDANGGARVLIEAPDLAPGAQVVTTQLPNALDGLLVTVAQQD